MSLPSNGGSPRIAGAFAALAVLLFSHSALAASLGNLTTQVGPNDSVIGFIEIIGLGDSEPAPESVRIAQPATFQGRGLRRSAQVDEIKARLHYRNDGRVFVRLESPRPFDVDTPVVLDLAWPTGSVTQEVINLTGRRRAAPAEATASPGSVVATPVANPVPVIAPAAAPVAAPVATTVATTVSIPAAVPVPPRGEAAGLASRAEPPPSARSPRIEPSLASPRTSEATVSLIDSKPSNERDTLLDATRGPGVQSVVGTVDRMPSRDPSTDAAAPSVMQAQLDPSRIAAALERAISGPITARQADRPVHAQPARGAAIERRRAGAALVDHDLEQEVALGSALKESETRIALLERTLEGLRSLISLRSEQIESLQGSLASQRMAAAEPESPAPAADGQAALGPVNGASFDRPNGFSVRAYTLLTPAVVLLVIALLASALLGLGIWWLRAHRASHMSGAEWDEFRKGRKLEGAAFAR